MSLIPFILDLADELHEFSRCLANGIDINDFGFGLYTGTDQHQPQQQQQQQNQQQQTQQQQQQQPQTSPRRSRTSSFSSFWMPSKRHHPYNRIKTACCVKSGEDGGVTTPEKSDASSSSIGGTPGKSASYSVVNKNGFQVSMNVKQFAPNELSVKTIDNCIVVEGRHDDKEDGHGVISRHFVRKYMLPKGYDPNDVLSTLSSDGILTVKAPPPPPPAAKNDEPNERIIEIQPTPGPTPVLVVSAKDTPTKETTKKLVTAPSARLECQLPEKRQKLDLPPESEPEPEESTPAKGNETDSASAAATAAASVAGTELESNDVEMEKADDEQITEIVVKQTEQQEQQKSDVTDTEEIDVEKKVVIIEKAEKQQNEKELEKNINETEKKLLDESVTESNGDVKNACEKMDESCNNTELVDKIEKIDETKNEKINDNNISVTKMEIDGVDEGHNEEDDKIEKTDNTQVVVATTKTADIETKTAVIAAAETESAKTLTDSEKTNNTDTSNKSSSSNDTTTTNTITTNKNTNASTNSSSTTPATTNNSTSNENSSKDIKIADNGVVTGEIPQNIPKSADSDAASAANAKTNDSEIKESKTESVTEAEVEVKTAVLNTETTTTTTTTTNAKKDIIVDNVALLKAATADPADITDTAGENVILSESMDGITTATDTNTNATTVDNVECSLFAKKSHLGNGNNTTATPIVGTEEMAN